MKISSVISINRKCHSHQWFLVSKCDSVQFSCSVVSDLWTTACQDSLSVTNCWSLPKPMSIESVMTSNCLMLWRPLLLLPSVFPTIRVFSNESALRIRWPKYWSFSFNISPSNEYSGLISFRMDWLGLLAVQGILKSLLQHHSSKTSILRHSAFFVVQLSHPYMTTRKTIALTRQTFVGKVMSLLLICCLGWSPLTPPHQKRKNHRSVASLGGVRLHRQPLFKNKHRKLPLGVGGGAKGASDFTLIWPPEIWYRQRLSDELLVTGTLEELGTRSCHRGYSAWSFFQILIPNRHRTEAQPSLRWISVFRPGALFPLCA